MDIFLIYVFNGDSYFFDTVIYRKEYPSERGEEEKSSERRLNAT